MSTQISIVYAFIICLFASLTQYAAAADNPVVVFKTTMGDIHIETLPTKAPISVKNFLDYVDAGFYKEVVFHRVIPGFMIQGGGFDTSMNKKPVNKSITNESTNGLKNDRGTLSMARTNDPDSATSQFFINLVDNASLDSSGARAGYAVFAKVIQGMDIVDAIGQTRTTRRGQYSDVPATPVIIESAARLPIAAKSETLEGRENSL